MIPLLALAVLGLTALDHWTTYLCLHQLVPGYSVREGNPLAAWLFEQVGLLPGLLMDSALTALGVLLLVTSRRLPSSAKAVFLMMLALGTAGAVANNVHAIEALGLAS